MILFQLPATQIDGKVAPIFIQDPDPKRNFSVFFSEELFLPSLTHRTDQMKVHLRLRVASFDINPRYFPTHTWEINVSTDSVFSHVISTHNSSVTGTHQLKSHELARCTLSADILPLFASLKT